MSDDRTAPKRIRISRLQETQLVAVGEVETAATAMYYDHHFDAAEVPTRSLTEITALTRQHNVYVAEADHVVAGYAAWRDEAPGVAYVEEISVHPDFQRFGVGSRLMNEIIEDARSAKLKQVTLRCWTRAPWAMNFYKKLGFVEIDASAPDRVLAWRDERSGTGKPFTRPGEIALWAPIHEAPAVEDEPEEEPTDDSV